MCRKSFIIIINILLCFLFPEDVKKSSDSPHISLLIHEELLNEFFNNIGEIKGEGTGASIDYTWYLLNPRIEITAKDALFKAKIRAKTENFRITRDVNGTVDIRYNEETNQIEVEIDTADVILDVDIFGKNFVLAEIDVAKYFTKAMKIDGPKSVNNIVEYQLPNGKSKEMLIKTKSYNLVLIENAIQLITSLEFSVVE